MNLTTSLLMDGVPRSLLVLAMCALAVGCTSPQSENANHSGAPQCGYTAGHWQTLQDASTALASLRIDTSAQGDSNFLRAAHGYGDLARQQRSIVGRCLANEHSPEHRAGLVELNSALQSLEGASEFSTDNDIPPERQAHLSRLASEEVGAAVKRARASSFCRSLPCA